MQVKQPSKYLAEF